MKVLIKDPLLTVARGLLWFLMAAMVVGALACLAAMVSLFAFGAQVTLELAREAPGLDFAQVRWGAELVLALVIGLLAMVVRMLWLLKQMVDSVGEGDPFVPENAARLTQMAWLTLAVQLIFLPIAGVATWLHNIIEESGKDVGHVSIDGGFDLNGLLLMLILFILARVFRKGAEMRADLEGMV
ncbi:DUF2975 domain-containing protein [Novosphingobium sp. YJ-S2-02]|uniref:DUF2975 domain-containing protein n=1 Tax=Novosphingobium aureum TaxID=2792964 RepID=A0A931MJL7_9SPHN|nr:DUF2975 domain-containing protein [Novosphingobium aureum]MBH0111655.1 DUF2975 domain-containing protein [Novosphingobium aureum]